MAPDRLRTLSLQTFKATIVCGIVGILIVLGLPANPSYADPSSALLRVLAWSGLALLAVAMAANIVSLVSGALAWSRGAGHCAWIIFCAILLLIPAVLMTIIFL